MPLGSLPYPQTLGPAIRAVGRSNGCGRPNPSTRGPLPIDRVDLTAVPDLDRRFPVVELKYHFALG